MRTTKLFLVCALLILATGCNPSSLLGLGIWAVFPSTGHSCPVGGICHNVYGLSPLGLLAAYGASQANK